MAGSSNIFSMIILLITSGALLVTPGILCDIPKNSESPVPSPQLPPEEYPGFFKFLESCAKKFNKQCGQRTYFAIYFANVTTTNECCVNMVNEAGKPCYDGLLRFTLKSRTFKDNVSHIITRAAKIWNNCASIANIVLPSPRSDY